MKAYYQLSKDIDVDSFLEKIANHFNTEIKTQSDDKTKIILVPSVIRLIQRTDDTKYSFKIRGASQEAINFLNSVLGQPISISEEKISLNDFVAQILKIPNVESKTKEEIIDILDLEDAEFKEYFKKMERFGKRGRGPKAILDAYAILTK